VSVADLFSANVGEGNLEADETFGISTLYSL